jgi:hypothetical protein
MYLGYPIGHDVPISPYGQPGDLLWVRETWGEKVDVGTLYKADGGVYATGGVVWKPSIHMRRSDSRLTLRVTAVRVQRVQEITEEDAIAEGITGPHMVGYRAFRVPEDSKPRYSRAEAAFEVLWDSINAKRDYSWDSNPWVWALTFERVS